MSERPITVTRHAMETYRMRLLRGRNRRDLEEEIRQCVETGLREGIVFKRRPPGFTLIGQYSKRELEPQHRFVQCDRESRFGFIVKRTPDEGDIVVTTLTRAGGR